MRRRVAPAPLGAWTFARADGGRMCYDPAVGTHRTGRSGEACGSGERVGTGAERSSEGASDDRS